MSRKQEVEGRLAVREKELWVEREKGEKLALQLERATAERISCVEQHQQKL